MTNLILSNKYLLSEFNAKTGSLVILKSPNHANVIHQSHLEYCIEKQIYRHPEGDAHPVGQSKIEKSSNSISTILENEYLTIKSTWTLLKNSPLLNFSLQLSGKESSSHLSYITLPNIRLTNHFNNIFEDEEDLFFDGAELKNGNELPCWRVLFEQGRKTGVILATRSKYDMSHIQFLERGFNIVPHLIINYSSLILLKSIPLITRKNTTLHVNFEIGPWSEEQHNKILDNAKLNQPTKVQGATFTRHKVQKLSGLLFKTNNIVNLSDYTEDFKPNDWRKVKLSNSQSEYVLFAGNNVTPPSITFNPKLSGVYKIYVGIAHGNGIQVQIGGDDFSTYRSQPSPILKVSDNQGEDVQKTIDQLKKCRTTPFHLYLNGENETEELFIYARDLTKKSITLDRYPDNFSACIIDYVRFEKISKEEEITLIPTLKNHPKIELSGLVDTPDVCVRLNSQNPDPNVYRSNIWEHYNCGIKKIFWRIDGQCSDFQSQKNTMRYISAKVHGDYQPNSKAYGKLLKKVDLLKLAVETSEKYNIQLYGWMRFNNYGGNVQSDFFKDNPQFHEEMENGQNTHKLCLAFPEVRKHKIDILIEACQYGLQGINLGFLRHPPILLYHPILVNGYLEKFGKRPPRQMQNPDPKYTNSIPPDKDEYIHWYQYRASFLTLFMNELKTELKENNLEHIKISIWVRPNHCLFDGIDLPDWLQKGLIDEVVVQEYGRVLDTDKVSPSWKSMVQKHVPLIRSFYFDDPQVSSIDYKNAISDGYDGICTYESNEAVLDNKFINIFNNLK